jgi:hypothetical protein
LGPEDVNDLVLSGYAELGASFALESARVGTEPLDAFAQCAITRNANVRLAGAAALRRAEFEIAVESVIAQEDSVEQPGRDQPERPEESSSLSETQRVLTLHSRPRIPDASERGERWEF